MAIINGTSGNDSLIGTSGADTISGLAGNDTIDGGAGNDLLDGGGNNNTYLFGKGDGADLLVDRFDATAYTGNSLGKLNTLQFKAGVAVADVTAARVGEDLVFKILGFESFTAQRYFFVNNPYNNYNVIQQVKFADGTTWNLADINLHAFTGSSGADTIFGTVYDDTINGGAGNDVLDGGAGNNIYLFGKGDGADVLVDRFDATAYTGNSLGKLNTLQFKAGVAVADVTAARVGEDLVFKILGFESFTAQRYFFVNNPYNNYNVIQQVKFADGTTWNLAEINLHAFTGSSGADTIFGTVDDDTINGGAGNDTLSGLGGNNTYEFGKGDGADLLKSYYDNTAYTGNSLGKFNTLQFKPGVLPSEVAVTLAGKNLTFTIAGSAYFTVEDFALSNSATNNYNPLQQVKFANGTTWNLATIVAQIDTGSTTTDRVNGISIGDASNSVAAATLLAGDSTIVGNVGGTDTTDIFKFVAAASGTVSLALTGLSADLDLYLENSTGTATLVNSTGSGTASESLNFAVTAGVTYLIEVYPYAAAGSNYTLSVNVPEAASTNRAPVLANALIDQSWTEGLPLTYAVPAGSFTDPDGDVLSFSAALADGSALPAWLSFNAASRMFSGTAPTGSADITIRLRATDAGGLNASDDVVIFTPAAQSSNTAPVSSNGSGSTPEDTALSASLPAATDANGDTITYAKTTEPAHGSLTVASSGSYTYVPAANYFGSDSFSFTVSDGRGGSNTYLQTLSIASVNDAPVVSIALPDQVGTAGSAFSYVVPANAFIDVETDGPTLIYSATLDNGAALPAWLSFNPGTRAFSGTPAVGNVGTINVRVTASDGSLSASDIFALSVGGNTVGDTIIGTAGNDYLLGTAGADLMIGRGGTNSFTGRGGNDTINGGAGIDTAIYTSTKALATLNPSGFGWTVRTPTDGTDTLFSVERLKFTDTAIALDLNGNAGITAKIIGAVFGATYLTNKDFVATGLQLLDTGMSYSDLVALATSIDLFRSLAGSTNGQVTNTQFVNLVYKNVSGVSPSASELANFVGLLDRGEYTQNELALYACNSEANLIHIDLAGLARNGIEFTPPFGG